MSAIPSDGRQAVTKDDLVKFVREANAQQNLKMFLGRMHELCFDKCITSPGSSMSRSDEACISNCVRKYMGLHDAVSQEWNSSVHKLQDSHMH